MARTDRRVKYTKAFLRQSLLELMKQRPIGKITVTELCEQADVNRNTFYAHYSSPEDLLQSIEQELFNEVAAAISPEALSQGTTQLLLTVCSSIQANADICKIIFSENGDKAFLTRIIYLARERAFAEWKAAGLSVKEAGREAIYAFVASGSVATIESWVQSGFKERSEDVARFIAAISAAAVSVFLQKDS